jgi:hypothetical protein
MPRAGGSDEKTRNRLALGIPILSIVGVLGASTIVIVFATGQNRPEMTRLVFGSVLPLFGTWVGTVLAFYFARENFQAATESTIRLAGRVAPATPVDQVMIPKAQIVSYDLERDQPPDTIKLADLHNRMTTSGKGRMPILDASGAVKYVVHDSTIATFASSREPPTAPDTLTETMADLLREPDHKK